MWPPLAKTAKGGGASALGVPSEKISKRWATRTAAVDTSGGRTEVVECGESSGRSKFEQQAITVLSAARCPVNIPVQSLSKLFSAGLAPLAPSKLTRVLKVCAGARTVIAAKSRKAANACIEKASRFIVASVRRLNRQGVVNESFIR
jgi:hypothetical protein